jgi:hypothetical protein
VDSAFQGYYRCPSQFSEFEVAGELSADEDYFTFGDAACYGRRQQGAELTGRSDGHGECVRLPFDLSEIVTNLRRERYRQSPKRPVEKITSAEAARRVYYFFRPILPVAVRKHLQKIRLSDWEKIPFPRWPVDVTVDTLLEEAMVLQLRRAGTQKIPFVWFWPDGAPSCAILTHDVEGAAGRRFCGQLMDLDDAYGIKASFQVIPAAANGESQALCAAIRARGFEVNVHDLNHDGRLFHSKQQFLHRVASINDYGRQFGSRGFRSAAMYRQQGWYDALHFSYDMSVPNVAHLEAQRGGCCTVMPYFIGNVLELPLTTIQDYSLFHILGDYSIGLWRTQLELILAANGLVTLLTHPDYLSEPRAQAVYRDLLTHVRQMRDEGKLWVALPGDVDRWWRSRSQLSLVPFGGSWRIEGTDSHRARVAFAAIESGHLVYELDGRVMRRTPLRAQ